MQFNDDHWKDKTYLVISEVVEEAGFRCVRADQVQTSGPVVNEVCRLLREADLVVIDSSGDSHSVSYEIGFCHGIGRPIQTTILLRNNAELPFHYRHFRHRVYRDTRHLKRLLRDFFSSSEPLRDDQYGYTFALDFEETTHFGYIVDGASCVFGALRKEKFSGRCECWSMEHFHRRERMFSVGIMLRRPKSPPTPDFNFWTRVAATVESLAAKTDGRISLCTLSSELSQKRAIQNVMIWCGAAQFHSGEIVHVLEDPEDRESFFDYYAANFPKPASLKYQAKVLF